MAAFCVGGICTGLDQFPTELEVREARQEVERGRSSEATRRALVTPPHVGPFARRPALRPGELPR